MDSPFQFEFSFVKVPVVRNIISDVRLEVDQVSRRRQFQVPVIRRLYSDERPSAEWVSSRRSLKYGEEIKYNEPNDVWLHQTRKAPMELKKIEAGLSEEFGRLTDYYRFGVRDDLFATDLHPVRKQVIKRLDKVRKFCAKQFLLGYSVDPRYLFNYYFQTKTDNESTWYMKSALYNSWGHIHTDRRLVHVGGRRTQGFIPLSYVAEAVTAVASAFSTYLMYKTGSNVYHSVKDSLPADNILTSIKEHIVDIIIVLSTFYRWYQGTLTTSEVMLILAGMGAWVVARKALLSSFLTTMKSFPTHSTHRETQGLEPQFTTLLQSSIALIAIMTLGSMDGVNVRSVMNSIRSLSATILTVKTIEQCFVAIVEFLPDIVQYLIAQRIPSFALYLKVNSDSAFKNFVVSTHKLQALGMLDLFYNSHNLNKFFYNFNYIKKLMSEEANLEKGLHLCMEPILDWYSEWYQKALNNGLVPWKRKLPFVVWISGDPGIGKSTFVNSLCDAFLGQLLGDCGDTTQAREKLVYSFNTSNKYFDGYNNQPIFVLNDYLQFANENEEQWLIRFADTLECPLEVASVDNLETGIKGEVRFTSRIIIITSNTTYLSNSTNVTNLEAFNRRRDYVVHMTWKNGTGINFENFDYSWANIIRKPAAQLGPQPLYPMFENINDLMLSILNQYLQFEHRSKLLLHPYARDGVEVKQFSLKEIVFSEAQAHRAYEKLIHDVWQKVVAWSNMEFFGIKFKYLLPLVLGAGSSLYVLYKSWVPSLVEKYVHSLSGDVATAKLPKSLRPLKRVVMGQQKNNVEACNKLVNNSVQISTYIGGPNGQAIKQTMWGWSPGGSLIITPRHLWMRGEYRVQEGDRFEIERNGILHPCVYRDNIYFTEDDVVVVNVLGCMPLFKDMSHFLLSNDFMVNSNGEDALVVIPQVKDTTQYPTIIPVSAFIVDAPYRDEFGHTYEGRGIWQYNHKLVKGDCGSLLVMSTRTGLKVCGIHVAGDAYSGNSEIVTLQLLDEAKVLFDRATQGFSTGVELTEDEFFDAESGLEGNWYFLGKAKNPPYQNTESEIRPSPLYEALQPIMTAPAVLTPSDPRLEEPTSPMLKSVAKYGVPVVPFSPDLMELAYSVVASWYEPIDKYNLDVGTYNDAINCVGNPSLEKLDLNTSAGYPWNIKRMGKKDLIENDNGILKIKPILENVLIKCDEQLDNHIMFPYTLVTTLKDERVALAKVKIGKTRTFMNFPVEYTILMRKYFDSFIDKETKHALDIGTTVGVNIYSSQWNTLFNMLNKFEHVTDGDFKSFDGTIRPEFFSYYARLVNSFYRDEHVQKRSMLVAGCCFAPLFVLDKVYVKMQGNPSGSRITTSFNSFVNRMYVVMSMLSVLPPNCKTVQYFRDNVKMFAHGDDHIIGYTNSVFRYWNALVLRDFMLAHGIDYTSSQKDKPLVPSRKLYDCYYLKSYFVYDKFSKTYRAGLDKEVIQEMVSWQRDNDIQSTKMIVNTALRYAYFWGSEYFLEIRAKILAKMRERHIDFPLEDYISLDIEYTYGDELKFSFVTLRN